MADGREQSFGSVSVVIPVSDRYDTPEALYEDYRRALSSLNAELEFIYVIDGQREAVQQSLQALQARGEPIRIISLGRRFGEATALSIGFRHCHSDAIITLPAFYQVDPSDLPRVVAGLASADMVTGRRWPREDSLVNRLQTRLFFLLVWFLTRASFRDLGCNVRALRRRVCDEVMLYGDQHRFLPVLATHQGFRVAEVDLRQSKRDRFRRVYAPGIYVRRVLDLLTVFFLVRFTRKPMRFFGLLGTATAGIGGLYVVYLVFERLFLDVALADRPALLLSSLLVVLGVQIFAMGLIGELIIFTHARHLQEYAIEAIVDSDAESGERDVRPLEEQGGRAGTAGVSTWAVSGE